MQEVYAFFTIAGAAAILAFIAGYASVVVLLVLAWLLEAVGLVRK